MTQMTKVAVAALLGMALLSTSAMADKEEAEKICPGLKLKDKYVNDVYDFAHEYASDSGNVPSC